MDIIVTTPKSQMQTAAREAAGAIAAGGGEYFRRFHATAYPSHVYAGDRVYYVEDGYIRGFAGVSRVQIIDSHGMVCDSTDRVWPQGLYVFMAACSWKWIRPIPMRGFQGFRYADKYFRYEDVQIIGNWLDPKPEVNQ